MALKLVTPLQNTFTRDLDATYIFACANFSTSQVVDGGIVAIRDVDDKEPPEIGVAVNDSETAADGETQVVSGTGVTHTLPLALGGGGTNARIVFNGTDRKDTAETKKLTVLEGSGFVVETDQCASATYNPGDLLIVSNSGASRGKLTNAITATEASGGISAVVDPIVAVVDSVVDQTNNILNIKWL